MKARLPAKTKVQPIRSYFTTSAVERSALRGLAASAVLGCLLAAPAAASAAERACPNGWHAEIVSVEGLVEIDSPSGWTTAARGQMLCDGDIIRSSQFGRASVQVIDGTLLRIAPHSAIQLRATQSGTQSWYDVVVKVLQGMIHTISRDPRSLGIDTPFVNAGIEGTEFTVSIRPDGAKVAVIEGEIALTNAAGEANVTGGAFGFAAPNAKPEITPYPDVLGAIDWTRRFAPIVAGELPPPDAQPPAAQTVSADFYARRAAARLAVGAIADADADLTAGLAVEPEHADILALKSLLALADGDRAGALELAERAVERAPDSAAARLALSHAARSAADRRRALENAEAATQLAPRHPYAWARVAELRFAAENFRGAREAAARAVELDPSLALGHTVLGFAELSGSSTERAEIAFRTAVQVDDGDPYAHLGLGLALYRRGEREAGRREIEVAVGLDPTDSFVRSHSAKVYDAEDRDGVAETVLEIAKALDAEDSTGYFYDALRKQHRNRPGEALLDFRRAFERNGRASVYSAQTSLDEDLLARSAGIGRLHAVLGVEQLGVLTATRAMFADPTDYSAHRLLADVYPHRPRHQLAHVHEVYQSILMQPLNVTPVQPQLTEARPFLYDLIGPSPMAFQEYLPMIRENGWSYRLSAVKANHGTEGLDFAVNGLHDRFSYNIGVFDFKTAGFRPNNDLDEQALSVLIQARTSESTTLTAELRSSNSEEGDLALRFDPEPYFPGLRERESADYALLGIRHRTPRGTWLGTVITEDVDADFSGLGEYSQSGSRRGTSVDLQHIRELGAWTMTAGIRYLRQQQTDRLFGPLSLDMLTQPPSDARHNIRHNSVYVYGNVELSPSVRATVGANLEEIAMHNVSHRRMAPKVGLMWDLGPRTALRATALRKLLSPFVSKRNSQPSLEPTHVVGFNQQFFGSQGEDAWRYGIAVDHEFREKLFGGFELSRRDVNLQFMTVRSGRNEPVFRILDSTETLHYVYLYWLPMPTVSVAASYEYEEYDGGGSILPEGFGRARTHRAPLRATFAHPSGFTASIKTTYVDQKGTFTPFSNDIEPPEISGDRFWSTDLSFAYRLPSKRGQFSLQVLNATDEEFLFQDTDPENPRIFPDRMVQIGFTLSY